MSTGIEDLTARAKQLIAERSYQDAVRACRRVLLSRPDEAPVRILLGKALLALRRYDEVRAEMMAVLRTDPREPVAHRLLGEAHLRAGDPHKARESVRTALELDPGDEEARELMGEIEEETAPVSATIDRWFDPEAVATKQTQPPAFDDEHTGPQPDVRHFDQQTSIEVDPSLTARAALADLERSDPPADEATRARAPALPPAGRANGPFRRGPASEIPPPPESRPPSAGPPRRPMLRTPAAPLSSRPPPIRAAGAIESSMPPPPSAMFAHLDEETAANRPRAKRDNPFAAPRVPEVTDELSLDDVDSIQSIPGLDDLASDQGLDELEGEPTLARAPAFADDVEALEGEATLVRPADEEEQRFIEQPTHALLASPPSPREPPRRMIGRDDYGPAAFPMDPLPGPKRSDPWEPTPAPPVQRHPGYPPAAVPSVPARTPAVSRSTTPTPHQLSLSGRARLGPRGRRIALLAAAGVLPVVLGVIAFFGVRAYMRSNAEDEIQAAAVEASNDGLKASLDRAISIAEGQELDDAESIALHARLLATAVLEHGADRGQEVEALVARLSDEDRNLPDARAAEAYLLLSRGEVQAADAAARQGSETNAELWRARALTAMMSNDIDRAADAAQHAVVDRPTSPRHVSLYALITALKRDTTAALNLLSGVEGGEQSPAVRIVRARIKLDSGSNPLEAANEAAAVLEQLGTIASPYEKAWAHLIRARQASTSSAEGSRELALEQADAAAELRPRWDESFALSLAETFLKLDEPGKARDVLRALPEHTREEQRRYTLLAEVSVAHGDWDEAESALARAGNDAATAWLRGRLLEHQGKNDEAREQYRRAMDDRGQAVRARARLGAMELAAGHPDRAVDLLEPALQLEPASLSVVPPIVRALLALDQAERADTIVTTALRMREGDPELLGVKAQVDLAQGQVDAALQSLRRVVELRPDDADARATLGEAARRAGDADAAREAYEAALERDDHNATALVGLAFLAVDSGDEEQIDRAVHRAEQAGVRGSALDRVRGEVLLMHGGGKQAVDLLRPLAEANEDDVELWVSLGRAQVQAEEDRAARSTFRHVFRLDEDNPEAHLAMALVETRAGQVHLVGRSIGAAERAGTTRNLGPRFEARVLVARGRLQYEYGYMEDATTFANQALEKDPGSAEAELLLANVAIENEQDPVPHLRRAVAGRYPPPEAVGRLASRVRGDEACDLARRYMAAAPEGYDAPDVRDVLARCE